MNSSLLMDNLQKGAELNQLSRLLLDQAASNWYKALAFELVAAVIGLVPAFFDFSNDTNVGFAIFGCVFIAIGYFFRLRFDDVYDRAETMRRQSVLSEGLDWPINSVQFSEWKMKAGKKILDAFRFNPRAPDYYETQEDAGPKRILQLTIESAHWMRNLYFRMRILMWILFGVSVCMSIILLGLTPFTFVNEEARFAITYFVFLALPILVSIDILGWALKLNRLYSSVLEIEKDLNRAEQKTEVDLPEVLRLVSEYNCQVVSGIPIHKQLFKWWHDDIQKLWDER